MPFNLELQLGRAMTALGGFMRIMGLTRILVAIFFCSLIQNPVTASGGSMPDPYSLTLAWNPSPSAEIIGCHLYYGTVSGEYTNTVVVGNVTTVTIAGLLRGVTYYFAITAIDADGQESDFSNEISYGKELAPPTLPGAKLQIRAVSDGQFTLTVSGPAGHTYDVEATEDFTTWTVIGTVTLDDSGPLEFTDFDASNFSQRFYRTRDTQPEPEPDPQNLPPTQLQIRGGADGQFTLTVTGPANHTYDVEATEDFKTWTVIGTVTLGDSGSLDFTDTDAPNFSQRFYRTRDTQSAPAPGPQSLPPAQLQIRGVADGQFTLTVTGPASHTFDIEATEDFTIWTVIGTVTLDDSGSLDFTDTDAPNFLHRFYRTRGIQP